MIGIDGFGEMRLKRLCTFPCKSVGFLLTLAEPIVLTRDTRLGDKTTLYSRRDTWYGHYKRIRVEQAKVLPVVLDRALHNQMEEIVEVSLWPRQLVEEKYQCDLILEVSENRWIADYEQYTHDFARRLNHWLAEVRKK